MTSAERLLWLNLRNRKFYGLKFLRQHPIIYEIYNNKPLYFIPDFYCAEKEVIVEVDGKIHEFRKEDDLRREDILKSLNLKIIRIKNKELDDVPKVLNRIRKFIFDPKII